jgi:hypothetical protein
MLATSATTMVEVKSTNIQSIGYDEKEAKLFVKFKECASLYQYDPVPPIVWLGLRECQSKGRYLKTQIIPYFRCTRIANTFKPQVRIH